MSVRRLEPKTLEQRIGQMRGMPTMVLPVEPGRYSSHLVEIMDAFMLRKKGDAVYVTFNKPASSLAELFQHIDHRNRLLFLDVISAHTGCKDACVENAFFIPFPGDLTGLMVVLSRTLKMHPFRFLFLDSLPSVLLYNDERTSTRFLHALAAMCKQHSIGLVMLSSGELPDSFQSSVSALASVHGA